MRLRGRCWAASVAAFLCACHGTSAMPEQPVGGGGSGGRVAGGGGATTSAGAGGRAGADAGAPDAPASVDGAVDRSDGATTDGPMRAAARLVFAHFMVSNRDYGGSVAGYLRDVREARAAGIDGFALNFGSWRTSNYKADIASLFDAVAQDDGPFVLMIAPDMAGDLTRSDLVEVIDKYANHPRHARRDGKPLVSGYGFGAGNAATEQALWQGVRDDLAAKGKLIELVPHVWMPQFAHQPSEADVAAQWQGWWGKVFDGYFYFGAAMLPFYTPSDSLLTVGERYASVTHAFERPYMAPVSPQYWGRKQTDGRRYYEYAGGEGIEQQWRSILDKQRPEMVELVTWNDFDEASYLSPIDDVTKYWPYVDVPTNGYYKPHAGLLALTSYFIDWYKRGAQPPVPGGVDHLYFAYRTHPKDAVATNDPRGPVTARYGTVDDVLYVTTLTTAAAELRVTTGGKTVTRAVPAGLHHERVPFAVGAQRFELWRGGSRLASVDGEPIVAQPALYNFLYTTGTAP